MMSSKLQLDPTGGDFLTSSWKELDSKFLSNDTLTNAQKMLQPVSPADRLDHILSHPNLYIRASDLILYIENVGLFHLKQHFQLIVEAIFGYNTKYPGWALRSITKSSNPREAGAILKLLGATGSLLNLATRFLEDPCFSIDVGLDKLPFVLSQRILHGDIPPYFSTRSCVTDPFPQAPMSSPMIKCLRVNTFEFFFISFTAHICALKGTGNTSDYLVGWGTMTDNLYTNLLDDYLAYFFPCNGHGVPSDNFRLSYQQVNDSMYIAQSLRSHMNTETSGPYHENVSPRLIKSSFLVEQTRAPPPRGDAFFRKSQAQKEVWRTETILLICTEMWMAHAPGIISSKNSSPVVKDQYGKVMLPAVDVVKSVRMLVRHSHFFLNCVMASVMHPMEELKRDVYPTYQKRLYKFLRHLFYNWPLDNSFRIVYETWLSYIQPWRYMHYDRTRTSPGAKDPIEEPVDGRWYAFIQENILFYSKIFSIMLNRMSRVDFATTKNAMMFYRVAKVYNGPEYLKMMLLDIDNIIMSYDQSYGSQINGVPGRSPPAVHVHSSVYGRYSSPGDTQRGPAFLRLATIKQIVKDWESSEFTYEPLFSDQNKKIVYGLLESAKAAKIQLQEVIDATQLQQKRSQSWWDKILGANKQYNNVVGQSINELNKAINQLDLGIEQFALFFDIPIVEPPENLRPVFNPTRLPRTTFIGNTLDASVLEGTENKITVLPSGTVTCDMLLPVGNPDYAPPRTDECSLLVKLTTALSGRLNDKFASDIMGVYFHKNWIGRLVRAAVARPVEYFDIEKKGRTREKLRKVLPPRISLRFLSSINFLAILAAFFVVGLLLGFVFSIWGFMFFLWAGFVFFRAISETETQVDDLIYLFGDRNYNVDFRGRKERPVTDKR